MECKCFGPYLQHEILQWNRDYYLEEYIELYNYYLLIGQRIQTKLGVTSVYYSCRSSLNTLLI